MIINAVDAVTLTLEKTRATVVIMYFSIIAMGRAINFNDQFFRAANKIHNVGTDRLLPDKFEVSQTTIAQTAPEFALSLSWLMTH